MSAVGIFVAKIMIFAFFVYALLTGSATGVMERELVVGLVAEEIYKERGLDEPQERERKESEVMREARQRVAKMSKQEIHERWKEGQAQLAAEHATDETAQKRRRLASHAAELRGDELGLSPVDPQREQVYQEELSKRAQLPPADLGAGR